jgi:hypothetical protein
MADIFLLRSGERRGADHTVRRNQRSQKRTAYRHLPFLQAVGSSVRLTQLSQLQRFEVSAGMVPVSGIK